MEIIESIASEISNFPKERPIRIVLSGQSADGLAATAILTRTLRRLDRKFSIIFREASATEQPQITLSSQEKSISLPSSIPEEKSMSIIAYMVSTKISPQNRDLAKLAFIGFIGGDTKHQNLSKTAQQMLTDTADIEIKKGLLLFPITRPIKKTLEYSTAMHIPGVTGSPLGVQDVLRETSIPAEKSLYDLTDEEMSRLVTAIMIRRTEHKHFGEIVGNLYLVKFFNRKEDIRELSVIINACLRSGNPDIALAFCLENERANALAREVYTRYKQSLLDTYKAIDSAKKIEGDGFVILNVKEIVQHDQLDTVTALLSSTVHYREGTILVGMTNKLDKIKIAARVIGKGRSPKEILEKVAREIQAEVFGHSDAAECTINCDREQDFITALQRQLELEVVKI